MADPLIRPASWTDRLPLQDIFGPGRPLEVDVGCGKGRFPTARALACPDTGFLGIDRRLIRIRKVSGKIGRAGLTNVRLLRVEAAYAVQYLLPPASISAFYVFFPDPWPKRRHRTRRLFSPPFLDSLDRTMTPSAVIHIATDHLDYFESIRRVFRADPRFAESPPFLPQEEERTEFEQIFLKQDLPIGRCSFRKTTSGAHPPAQNEGAPPLPRP